MYSGYSIFHDFKGQFYFTGFLLPQGQDYWNVIWSSSGTVLVRPLCIVTIVLNRKEPVTIPSGISSVNHRNSQSSPDSEGVTAACSWPVRLLRGLTYSGLFCVMILNLDMRQGEADRSGR